MSLACDCDYDWYPEPGDWYWSEVTHQYSPLPFKQRKRCCSCRALIDLGALAVEHPRVKVPATEVEIKIFTDVGEIPLASDWMCETCGDLFFSLTELGYCVGPRSNMHDLVKEYTNLKVTE